MIGAHMDAIILATAALATARITRLVTTDRITQAPRSWIIKRLNPEGLLAYLIVCDWCASVYVGAGVAALLWVGPAWIVWPLYALAFSYVAGYLARGETE